ncbi:putative peptidase_S74 domain-containing protein [Rhizobium phage RHph_I46]|uniref:Putative peptidase_S74 domain-containing protein n=1 Tax=Rhizobium phage RHph_I1_9 TaxID=2509729 RepID=A0A7S5R9F3_9CAUD|nr:baseplate wedge subunit [Rhizobium phage RHph_I1_9]QIG69579.1 putative peptidase_S74 domain-containing protein [Rhizobium phage RHph_I46]QIG70860.1 putative peptidase_S74 domain-containing protein [Rhizobium phage RHph_I9]QIG73447.1 putative peptidase_S74 domain-containing protein [Rhizobium phage RHph_I1_9]QIG76199.1 putative peptidase_S74 domain-containing protein [Rhizobium phage RHph_I34]
MVDVTPIPPITPGSTNVGESITSANEAFTRIVEQGQAINGLLIDVGDKTDLQTTVKTDLVSAINEILTRFNDGFLVQSVTGDLTNLTTTNKSNLVSAVNEIVGNIGNLSSLSTSDKTSIVAAINEVVAENAGVGNLQNLSTIDKTNIVAAINELSFSIGAFSNLDGFQDIISAINSISDDAGDISTLTTVSKTSLVAAINELVTKTGLFVTKDGSVAFTGDVDFGTHKIKNLAAGTNSGDAVTVGQILDLVKIGDVAGLATSTKENTVLAINEVIGYIGQLNLLNTTTKTNIVAAINEIVDNIDYQDMQVKLSGINRVSFGYDITSDHDQTFDFRSSSVTGPSDFDFRVIREQGTNGVARLIQNGSGHMYLSTNDAVNGVIDRVRLNADVNNPFEIYKDGIWVAVATGGASLPLSGGTMTGPIQFDKTLSSNNILLDLQQGYGIYSDNTGTYTDSDRRLWIDGPGSGEIHIGPKTAGNLKGIELKTDRLDVTGEIFSSSDITLLSDARVKTDVETIEDAVNKVYAMRGVHYVKDGKFSTGLIAQELELVAPELVKDAGDLKSVNYQQLNAYLIEAVKDLVDQVNDLNKRIIELENNQ